MGTVYDNYSDVIRGNTVGLFAEGSASFLAAGQIGNMLALDKNGISYLGYAGGGGSAGAGLKLSAGVFVYGGTRDNLLGWGGEVGSEVFIGSGGSLSYVASGGHSGGSGAVGVGGKFSLIHGYVNKTWEIHSDNFLR